MSYLIYTDVTKGKKAWGKERLLMTLSYAEEQEREQTVENYKRVRQDGMAEQ